MTDILIPSLCWIDGRCYRVNDSNTRDVTAFQEHDLYENEHNDDGIVDEGDEDDFEIITVDDSRFSTCLHVSQHYIGSIIGKKGATKSRIERDTRTDIKIPKIGQTGDITIFGSNVSNIKAARRRINIIVTSSRMKQRSTHFISLPMNNSDITRNFELFKETVLRDCSSKGLDESLFIRPQKLHLTLGVMCLMDNEERLLASKLLTEAKEKVVKPLLGNCPSLRIRLRGLSYMNDDPSAIDVLYGCVEEENGPPGIIQRLADGLVDHFYKAGYMDREYGRDNVKLHVTLINSKYRSRTSTSVNDDVTGSKRQARLTFDGSEILNKYADYDFGVTELKEIHLSQRHSMGNDGYYQPTCVISCDI
ncbi:unnamed protein product [Diatraea saccharalis]|uniref:K Homology domain-containing protein n=1 Tax=Diatraea saccharalis TaxID=40085 RepID=A0A9N9W8E4_9NEOP|nr:unnamed protein product [Diatraea saccharalis]